MTFNVLIEKTVSMDYVTEILNGPEFNVVKIDDLEQEELQKFIPTCHALIVRSELVKDEFIEKAKELQVIGRAGSGTNNIDVKKATQRGVVVMNVPDGNSDSVAQLTALHMLALMRNFTAANKETHQGMWPKNKFVHGMEVNTRVLGLIGCGRIGAKVTEIAKSMDMVVVAYDPYLPEEIAKKMDVQLVSLDDLLARADVISLHAPLTNETRHILNADALNKCKKGAYIVNCARGELIDEVALVEALESGQIKGVGLDVMEKEPAKESPLFGRDNVNITPHLGASTDDAQKKAVEGVSRQIDDLLRLGIIRNAVNAASLSAHEAEQLAPYIGLAGQLASLARQIMKKGLKKVTITYEGEAALDKTTPLTNIVMTELLRPIFQEAVTMMNVEARAAERDIIVEEIKRKADAYDNAHMRLSLEMEACKLEIAGHLVSREPRILKINNVVLDTSLKDHMVCVRNENTYGVFADITRLFKEARININFIVGNTTRNEDENIILLGVKQEIPADLLLKIKGGKDKEGNVISGIPGVIDAWNLSFTEGFYTLTRPKYLKAKSEQELNLAM